MLNISPNFITYHMSDFSQRMRTKIVHIKNFLASSMVLCNDTTFSYKLRNPVLFINALGSVQFVAADTSFDVSLIGYLLFLYINILGICSKLASSFPLRKGIIVMLSPTEMRPRNSTALAAVNPTVCF